MSDFINITRNNNDIISTYSANPDSEGEVGEGGLVAQLAQRAQLQVNIESYGAKPNDSTFDNTTAIQNAINDVSTKYGGGTVVISNLYYFKPKITLKDHVTLTGNGIGCLTVIPNAGNYDACVSLQNTTGAKVTDLTIDQNYSNNTSIQVDPYNNPAVAVYMNTTYKAQVLRNVIHGCGVWAIIAQTSSSLPYNEDITADGNIIDWVQATNSTQQGGLPTNVKYDNTQIFIDSKTCRVTNNHITTTDAGAMTGIEVHKFDGVADKNTVRGFRTGMYLVNVHDNPSSLTDDSTLSAINNKFFGVNNGIVIDINQTNDVANIKVDGNQIFIDPTAFSASYATGISLGLHSVTTNTVYVRELLIQNNLINFINDTRTFTDPNTVFNFVGINMSAWNNAKNIKICDNMILHAPAIGINIGGKSVSGTNYTFDGVSVVNNTIIDAGMNTNISTSSTVYRSAIAVVGYFKNIFIGLNTIIDRKASGTYYNYPLMLIDSSGATNNVVAVDQNIFANGTAQFSPQYSLFPVTQTLASNTVGDGTKSYITVTTPVNHARLVSSGGTVYTLNKSIIGWNGATIGGTLGTNEFGIYPVSATQSQLIINSAAASGWQVTVYQ